MVVDVGAMKKVYEEGSWLRMAIWMYNNYSLSHPPVSLTTTRDE